jgi:hypothetical protein
LHVDDHERAIGGTDEHVCPPDVIHKCGVHSCGIPNTTVDFTQQPGNFQARSARFKALGRTYRGGASEQEGMLHCDIRVAIRRDGGRRVIGCSSRKNII